MAARKTRTTAPVVTPLDVTHTLAKAKPSSCGAAHDILVTTYGEAVADQFASKACKRLPRHAVTAEKGHVEAKPLGLLKGAARQRAIEARRPKAAPKTGKAARPVRVTRAAVLDAAAKMAAGELSATAYMSLVSAYGQRRTKKALASTAS